MKTRCACCNSNNLRICSEKDKQDFDEGMVLEHCYECNDCEHTGILDTEDWK